MPTSVCGFIAINSPSKKDEPEEDETIKDQPITPSSSSKKRQRSKIADEAAPSPKRKAVPTSLAEASEADKLLIHMKDVEGKSWPEIRKAWDSMTGEVSGVDMIRKRYKKMKTNFAVVDERDVPQLIEIKKEVETKFESEKWNRIAESLHAKGGPKYDAGVVMKLFKDRIKQGLCH
ncbi:hypothetical protein AAP_06001 [Ascosphaera apis ARSEF 7405]|uniref:Uncharacterized protein n=1 Tax=Ascosphaera apis ARSEF 7405 TaxID=392613 RepID=A0A167V511_9EURO|nr:hypothetical protein AAP_06001 [Ascosphaera apis ARSEF 7405]